MKARADRWHSAVLGSALAVAACFASPWAAAAERVATDTPEATVRSLHDGLIAVAREHAGASVEERYRALEPLVEQTHDLAYIAEFALRRQWPMLSEADRQRFVAAFSRLSVMNYASRFRNVGPDTFKPGGAPTIESGRAHVLTAIARSGEPDVTLEYLLEQKDGAWRIINIIADGVSDLALKRAEYQRVLSTGSIDDLVKHVDEQTARLEK